MLSQADRIAFSTAIINDLQQINGLKLAQSQLSTQLTKDQALDQANKNLFDPTNALINGYQGEFSAIDGNLRTSLVEQDLVNATQKKQGNYLFPNVPTVSIPPLSAENNVWVQTQPYLLGYGSGKNIDSTYTTGASESALIANALSLISSAASYTDIQNTTGLWCNSGGTCSLPAYNGDQTDCLANSGTWYASDTITSYPAVQTLKTNLVSAINNIITQLNLEIASIPTNDPNSTNQTQNTAAKNYINNTLLPALNAWIAYSDFATYPGAMTCAAFNSYDSSTLAPTKLHSTQLAALQTALTNRQTFLTTRISQLNTVLGSISQTISTGVFTGSGLYFTRANYLNLRTNVLTGSLSIVQNDLQAQNSQNSIINNLQQTVSTYMTVCPTVLLTANGTGTTLINVQDSSYFSVGNVVYIMSNTQAELTFSIKTISGNSLILNNPLPLKFTTLDSARIYRDLT